MNENHDGDGRRVEESKEREQERETADGGRESRLSVGCGVD